MQPHRKKPVFFSDLDNTLIYSYQHEIGEAKRCVEIYQGREISFMTEKTYEYFCQAKEKFLIVPVTTRTIEQYKRIELGFGAFPYALVCNGGILLKEGREEESWHKDSLAMILESETELLKGEELLLQDPDRCFEVRNVRKLFLFTKSSHPARTMAYIQGSMDTRTVDVLSNGAKVYIIPKRLNKGEALRRFKEKMNLKMAAAAGDSIFDISMLQQADLAIAPKELWQLFGQPGNICPMPGQAIFSEELLLYLLKNC